MSVTEELKDVPGTIVSSPWLAIGIGFLMLVLVLIIEAFKPGLLTGPIRRGLGMVGLKSA